MRTAGRRAPDLTGDMTRSGSPRSIEVQLRQLPAASGGSDGDRLCRGAAAESSAGASLRSGIGWARRTPPGVGPDPFVSDKDGGVEPTAWPVSRCRGDRPASAAASRTGPRAARGRHPRCNRRRHRCTGRGRPRPSHPGLGRAGRRRRGGERLWISRRRPPRPAHLHHPPRRRRPTSRA